MKAKRPVLRRSSMTSRRKVSIVLILLLVLAVPQDAFGHSGGRTGSASSGCACHGGGANQVTPSLSGFPADGYVASSTYGLTIGGTGGPSGSGGGFNLDADLGSFSNPGSNAQISNGEVTHSNANARTWTVDWTAPSSGSGNVTFDLTVNFVNGNGNTGGDGYGTDSWSLAEEVSDSDGDGWSDADEGACGTDANDSSSVPTDTDSDGICDPVDTDDDDDGWSDSAEQACGSNPNDASSIPDDTDSDGTCDSMDTDDDNDGWSDSDEDDCGSNSTDSSSTPTDTDSDGTCDPLDLDDD